MKKKLKRALRTIENYCLNHGQCECCRFVRSDKTCALAREPFKWLQTAEGKPYE